jgi:uncharacterized RDD family membrane protein YckC
MRTSKFCFPWLLIGGLVLALSWGVRAQSNTNDTSTNAEVLEQNSNPAPVAAVESDGNWKQLQPIVQIGQDVVLKADEEAEAVVVVGGSAAIHGHVRQSVVVIGGNLDLDGTVNDAAVAVLGSINLGPGSSVRNDAVAVLGNLAMAKGTKVGHNAVSVGGHLDVAEGASIGGQKVSVVLPFAGFHFGHLSLWLRYCVLEMRPLAFQVHWVWIFAGLIFLLYLLVAAVFQKPVQLCVDGLNSRPATTFLLGFLATMLVPVVLFLLVITGIGIFVIPFLIAALLFGTFVGKAAFLEWVGFQLLRPFGAGARNPLIAFIVGSILIVLLYVVPFLGLLTFAIASVWSLGCALAALFSSFRRELPVKSSPPTPPPGSGPSTDELAAVPMSFAASPSGANPGLQESGTSVGPAIPELASTPPPLSKPVTPPVYPLALSLPKASFWERMAAGFLDLIVVGLICLFVHFPPLVALAYFVGMWMWKGTTVGGVILKLQVVRTDGSKITIPVALVRSLGAVLSAAALFLGFLWIAWDKDNEAWHDKLAGTAVVRGPQSIALICF